MRKSPRVPVDVPVALDAYGQTLSGRATNLGLRGAFISLESQPPLHSVVSLRLSMAPRQDLEILARVVRTGPHGIGVEFLDLDVHSKSLLNDFLTPLWPRKLKACPFCGQELPKPNSKHCPVCQKSMDWRHNGDMKEQDPEEMIGTCKAMRDIFCMIRKLAVTDVPVLITGASGTGKEMVARAIHQRSNWARGPFVEVNCGAIPRELLESELFGHGKGAFTGAYRTTIGHVERAQGGTLFLDEVGELPVELQVKLLRFLQEFTFHRVGGRQPFKVDVRVISATNSDLSEMIAAGRFREDLYYRLDVVNIDLPALKDRDDDCLIMANVFLKRYATRLSKDLKGFTAEAMAAIQNHAWPGNVRELINRVRRAVVMTEGGRVGQEHLGLDQSGAVTEPVFNGKSLKEARAEFEARLVSEALHHFQGNVFLASRALRVSRSTMYHFIQKYQLKPYLNLVSSAG
ncbi:MAG: sigma 54-interacting transcriptional regulator [Desulfobaccales bacterium]